MSSCHMRAGLRSRLLIALLLLLTGAEFGAQAQNTSSFPVDVGATDPKRVVREIFGRLRSGDLGPTKQWFSPELFGRLLGDLDALQGVASDMPGIREISVVASNRDKSESVYEIEIEHLFPYMPPAVVVASNNEKSYWLIGYNAAIGVIDTLSFRRQHGRVRAGGPQPYFVDDPAKPNMKRALEILSGPAFSNQNSVQFLFATTRQFSGGVFTSDRGNLTFGGVDVHVPDDHKMGRIELPKSKGWIPFRYEEKLDLVKHFAISRLGTITNSDWSETIRASKRDEALIFVHGFNNTFNDGVYRAAQILWDLQYKGVPILFSWPSRGGAKDPASIAVSYAHDRDSSLTESDTFYNLLRALRPLGIRKVHLLVHSMGNFLVINALRRETGASAPIEIAEWIMAAPDIDLDQFWEFAPTVRSYVERITLYASALDNALLASMAARANKPRAGFVLNGMPLVVRPEMIDTIDVTALGGELFGLNHDVFASNRSLIDEIGLVLDGRSPDQRLRQIRPVPQNPPPPQYWRFSN
jgi:esterase/lipase superfamily enzyme